MIYKVIGHDFFPGTFLAAAADAHSDGEGRVGLIVNGAADCQSVVEKLRRWHGSDIAGVVIVGVVETSPCEPEIECFCRETGAPLVVLRCAPVVGTGMDGRWRDMVNAIYRGVYAVVDGNKSRASIIHALDVAEVAVRCVGLSGLYYICDGFTPHINDIANAFAVRLSAKRIPVLSQRKARIAAAVIDIVTFGHAGAANRLKTDMSDTVMPSPCPLYDIIGFVPRDTVNYLLTHKYEYDDI